MPDDAYDIERFGWRDDGTEPTLSAEGLMRMTRVGWRYARMFPQRKLPHGYWAPFREKYKARLIRKLRQMEPEPPESLD